jgi:hypothetical protein
MIGRFCLDPHPEPQVPPHLLSNTPSAATPNEDSQKLQSVLVNNNRHKTHPTETTMKDLTGKHAIPFSLHDCNGSIHHLNDYRGNWLLLVFHRHLG